MWEETRKTGCTITLWEDKKIGLGLGLCLYTLLVLGFIISVVFERSNYMVGYMVFFACLVCFVRLCWFYYCFFCFMASFNLYFVVLGISFVCLGYIISYTPISFFPRLCLFLSSFLSFILVFMLLASIFCYLLYVCWVHDFFFLIIFFRCPPFSYPTSITSVSYIHDPWVFK